MRTAVVEEPQKLSLQERPTPEPGPAQVRIRIEGTGICASDLPVWEGRPWFSYPLEPGRPGHEGWGRVEAVGPGVEAVAVGDRVAAFSMHTYAEFDVADADQVVKLPPELDGRPFPGEPLACAMNAFTRCGIEEGASVAIVGAGFQGLLLAQLAVDAGARVVVLSRRASALAMAREMGASHTVVLDDHCRARDDALGLVDADGFDTVIEAAGQQWPLDLAGELTKTRGRLVVVGYHQDPRQVNMQLWNWRGLDVINAHERDPAVYVRGMHEAVHAVTTGRLNPFPMLERQYPLENLDQAFEDARRRPEGFLKAVMVM
jgi:threonine dehydrogenase-like Zn-dependent dehydrogenase